MGSVKDTFGRTIDYLRLSVTDRCNLRCIYCMPSGGVEKLDRCGLLTFGELTRIVRAAASLGVRKVRITGGEPLIRKDLPRLIESIADIEGIEDISLTTNGLLLERQARSLAVAGLRRVNVSLDSMLPDRYRRITRGGDLEQVLDGILEAERRGLLPVKINVVVLRGINDDELEEYARLTLHTPFHVRFIEWMPSRITRMPRRHQMPVGEMRARLAAIAPLLPVDAMNGSVARYYRFPGARGVMGFISPVTQHFCRSCNRIRITADGRIRPCLFSPAEIDIRADLRREASDDELSQVLLMSILSKPGSRPALLGTETELTAPMSRLGG